MAHAHQEFPGVLPPALEMLLQHRVTFWLTERINKSIETSINSNVVMTLLFKIINLMANLKIVSDPLLALQMLMKGGSGSGEFGENDELGTVSKFNIIPITSK